MQFDFPALGTHWWIEVWDDINDEAARDIEDVSRRFVSEFEQRYSRFLPDSEISRLNRDRRLALSAESDTRRLLQTGIDLYRRTHGVFNVMIGHILEARGYDGAYSFIDKGSAELEPGNPVTDIVFTDHAVELRFGNVDIGGYGKGWCIDRLAELLRDRFGLEQFLINGGGDIYVTHQDNEPVEIHLQHPITKQLIGSIHLMNRGFASSSPHLRSWPIKDAAGATQHHIVTTEPVKDVVYLTAPTATDADAFATTLLQVDDAMTQALAAQNFLTIL